MAKIIHLKDGSRYVLSKDDKEGRIKEFQMMLKVIVGRDASDAFKEIIKIVENEKGTT